MTEKTPKLITILTITMLGLIFAVFLILNISINQRNDVNRGYNLATFKR